MELLVVILALALISSARAHGGHEESNAKCEGPAAALAILSADYFAGAITLDGDSSDWESAEGHDFSLYPALDPISGDLYPHGKMTIKVIHDGRDLFFLLRVPGDLHYKQGVKHGNPSVALMFPVGDDATYTDMGGCSESLNCSKQSCGGHEVDIMFFSISNAVPGRLYGANLADNLNGTGKDSTGTLHDLYAWNPHCRYFDGTDPDGVQSASGAQNDWKGVWSHSSIDNRFGLTAEDSPYNSSTSTTTGSFIFEFTRPLRTSDRLQQDAQFTIGKDHRFAAAFWFPEKNSEWSPIQHFSANCDWIPLKISAASQNERAESAVVATSMSVFSLIFALGALVVSGIGVWWMKSNKQVPFVPIGGGNL